jgi:hypothetical protein
LAACSLLRRTLRYRTNLEDRMELEPGATNTLTVVVDESMTADRFGNTGVQVLATPMLVSYFELAAHQLAMPALEPGTWRPPRSACRSPFGRPLPSAMGGDCSSGSRPTTNTNSR